MKLSPEEEKLVLEHRAAKAKAAFQPKSKAEYTVEEKIAFFDDTYNNALRILREQETNGYHDEDEPMYAYQNMMNLLGKDFWKYFNSI